MEVGQPQVDLLGKDGPMRRTTGALAATLLVAALTSGCGSALQPAKVEPLSSATATATQPSPGPPPRVPKVGDCYQLDYTQATSPTSDVPPVPCKTKHDTVTVYVGTIDPVVDGHLLAVDSDAVTAQVAKACPSKLAPWVGGSEAARRLSRFTVFPFSPTLAQSDAGANWFRCDLVAVQSDKVLAKLTGTKGALDQSGGLDTYGICGNAAPDPANPQPRVICSQPHTWRAVTTIPIPDSVGYQGTAATNAASGLCKVEAQQRATDPLVYKFSFEWPSRADFDADVAANRPALGLCWVPDTH
jgi:hypothetical protein